MLDRKQPAAKPSTNRRPRCSRAYIVIMNVSAMTPKAVTAKVPVDHAGPLFRRSGTLPGGTRACGSGTCLAAAAVERRVARARRSVHRNLRDISMSWREP